MNVCVLSPHRDDAAFSCGLLLVALLRQNILITIVNVCTISAYAPYLAEANEPRAEQVTGIRAGEDEDFTKLLMTTANAAPNLIRLVDLHWKDAPLRRGIVDEEVLAAGVDEREIVALRQEFAKLESANLILTPAAIGNHMDHMLVRDAALTAFPTSKLLFYEDLPYANREKPSMPPAGLQGSGEWLSPAIASTNAKRNFALQYPSQISSDVADELQSYADKLQGRERFYGDPEAVRTISAVFQPQDAFA